MSCDILWSFFVQIYKDSLKVAQSYLVAHYKVSVIWHDPALPYTMMFHLSHTSSNTVRPCPSNEAWHHVQNPSDGASQTTSSSGAILATYPNHLNQCICKLPILSIMSNLPASSAAVGCSFHQILLLIPNEHIIGETCIT